MKVRQLRDVLQRLAEMQRPPDQQGPSAALLQLAEVLSVRDKDEVSKVVEDVQRRRNERAPS